MTTSQNEAERRKSHTDDCVVVLCSPEYTEVLRLFYTSYAMRAIIISLSLIEQQFEQEKQIDDSHGTCALHSVHLFVCPEDNSSPR